MKPLSTFQKSSSVVLIFWGLMMTFSQTKKHPLERAEELQKTEQKTVVVFVHTDWCNYCQAMQNATFKDEEVQKILNENFYFVDINGEEKAEIYFAGTVFKYQPTGINTGHHQLADSLGNIDGQLSYPTLVILNPKNEIVLQYTGFLTAAEILKLLKKINDD
ncbi:thioredoxin family protein [Chryseobacterium sp. MDT2-18]|uniref:thioredoxin family protein n=1 Tax=Chryseobacterium sp. MDT2-18 TaxID=1259136 RepID=UPI00278816A7|nr:thioredoxin family protein [Chryseobacterium sp. MDT2-18]MDQ0477817.1 thioredoxin-related protein [Chryseobacterium sp. MDT2-18]